MSLARLVPVSRIKYLTKIRDITIDDFTFRLHYRFTFSFLLIGSLMLTGEQFFGKPIQCITTPSLPKNLLEAFCWIEGTFTIPKGLMKVIGLEVAAPGIEQYTEVLEEAKHEKDEVITQSYYQWVGVVLFLQSLCFYVSHLLWKVWEKGRIGKIINDLNKIILSEKKKKSDQFALIDYLQKTKGKNNSYAFRYFICEVFNLINVILQMVFVNWFLGGEFSTYGFDVLKFMDDDPSLRVDPMVKVFPKMTKCTFRKFGPSGEIIKTDHLCLLPLNILNEKLYVVFWFWFYFVLVCSIITVIYRILVIAFPSTRLFLMGTFHRLADPQHIDIIISNTSYSDWFLIYLLSNNLDPMHFRDVLKELANKIKNSNFESFKEEEDEDEKAESNV